MTLMQNCSTDHKIRNDLHPPRSGKTPENCSKVKMLQNVLKSEKNAIKNGALS